jgi:hypothetical protein
LDAWLASPASSPSSQPLLIATGVSAAALAAEYPGAAILNSGDTYGGRTLYAAYYIAPGQQFDPGTAAWLNQYNASALNPVHVLDVYHNGQYVTTVTTNNMNALAAKYPFSQGYTVVNTQRSSYPTLTVNSVLESISEANASAEQSFLAGITSSLTYTPTSVHQRPVATSNGNWSVTVQGTKYTFQNKSDAEQFISEVSNSVMNGVSAPQLYDVGSLSFLSQGVAQSYATGLNAAAQQEAPLYEEAYLTSQLRSGPGGLLSLSLSPNYAYVNTRRAQGQSTSQTLQFQNAGQATSAIDALVSGRSVFSAGSFTFATEGAAQSYLTSVTPTYSHAELDALGMPSGYTVNGVSFATVSQAQAYVQSQNPGATVTPTYDTLGALTGFTVSTQTRSAQTQASGGILGTIYGGIKGGVDLIEQGFGDIFYGAGYLGYNAKALATGGQTVSYGEAGSIVAPSKLTLSQASNISGQYFGKAFIGAELLAVAPEVLPVSATTLGIGGGITLGLGELQSYVMTGRPLSFSQSENAFLFGEAFTTVLAPAVAGIGVLSSSAASGLGSTAARVLGTTAGIASFGAIQTGLGEVMGGNAFFGLGSPSRSPLGAAENAVIGGISGGLAGWSTVGRIAPASTESAVAEVGGKTVYPEEPSPNAVATYLSTTEIGSDVTADFRYIASGIRGSIAGVASNITGRFDLSGIANAGTTSEPGLEGLFVPENGAYVGPITALVTGVQNAATFGAYAAEHALYSVPGRVSGFFGTVSDTLFPDLGLGTSEEGLVPMFGAEREYIGPVSSFVASTTRSVYGAGYSVSDALSSVGAGIKSAVSAPGTVVSDFLSQRVVPGDLGLGTSEEGLQGLFGPEREYIGPVSSFTGAVSRTVYGAFNTASSALEDLTSGTYSVGARVSSVVTKPLDFLYPSDEMTPEQALSMQNYSAIDYLFDRSTTLGRVSTGLSDVFGQIGTAARNAAGAPVRAFSDMFLNSFSLGGLNVGTSEENLTPMFGNEGVQGIQFGIGTAVREGISPITDIFAGVRGAAGEFATKYIPDVNTDVFSAEGLRLGFSAATSTLSRYAQAYLEGPISDLVMFGRATLGELEWLHIGENLEETKVNEAANLEEFNNAVGVNPNVSQEFAITPFKTDTEIENENLNPGAGNLNPNGDRTLTILRQQYNMEQGFSAQAAGRYGYGWLFLTTPESFAVLTSGGSLVQGVRASTFARSSSALLSPATDILALSTPAVGETELSLTGLEASLGLGAGTSTSTERRLLSLEGLDVGLSPAGMEALRFLQLPVLQELQLPREEQVPAELESFIQTGLLQEQEFTLLVGQNPKLYPSFGPQKPRHRMPKIHQQKYAYGEEFNAVGYEGVFGAEIGGLLDFSALGNLGNGGVLSLGAGKRRNTANVIDEFLGVEW